MKTWRIKIITCYYGAFPQWISLWLRSCRYNQDVDFLVVTDITDDVGHLPSNVSILRISLEELKGRFEKVLGFSVCLSEGYKLCDFRPLYGLAFTDELAGYDFWGHSDMDMIFGDLRKFITDRVLETYDRIGSLGALTLYRNNKKINCLYRGRGSLFSYKEVFTNKESYGYDEYAGMNLICRKRIPWYRDLPIADMEVYSKRMRFRGHFGIQEFFYWKGGHIYSVINKGGKPIEAEYAYLHFSGKKHPSLIENVLTAEQFYITTQHFYERRNQNCTLEELCEVSGQITADSERREYRQLQKDFLKKLLKAPVKSKLIWLRKHIGIFMDAR